MAGILLTSSTFAQDAKEFADSASQLRRFEALHQIVGEELVDAAGFGLGGLRRREAGDAPTCGHPQSDV